MPLISAAENRARNADLERIREAIELAAQHPVPLVVDSAAIERRKEIAAVLLSYYRFLTSMYLPTGVLKAPPEEGWPWINAERFAFLGQTDAVIDLYKHIPYIYGDRISDCLIDSGAICKDYTSNDFKHGKYRSQSGRQPPPQYFDGYDEPTWAPMDEPQHIVTLARPADSRGYYIVLDTRDGKAAIVIPRDHQDSVSTYEYGSLQGIFEEDMQRFRSLSTVPLSPTAMMETWVPGHVVNQIKGIHSAHGWPSTMNNKTACMREVEEAYEAWWHSQGN